MSEGFVIDQTYGGAAVPGWVEGSPQRSVWTGVKLVGKPRVDIATWRCGRCGYLEQYAAGAPGRHEESRKQVQIIVLVIAAMSAILLGAIAMLLVL